MREEFRRLISKNSNGAPSKESGYKPALQPRGRVPTLIAGVRLTRTVTGLQEMLIYDMIFAYPKDISIEDIHGRHFVKVAG